MATVIKLVGAYGYAPINNMKNFWRKSRRLRGNILAMTLIVGGIAGITTVSIAALTLKDTEISSKLEDSQDAYQAAMAGIKLGLLYKEYRPQTIELSSECQDNTPVGNTGARQHCTQTPTQTAGNPIRIHIERLGCSYDQLTNTNNKICAGLPRLSASSLTTTSPYWDTVSASNDLSNILPQEMTTDLKIWYQDTQVGYPDFFCPGISSGNHQTDCAGGILANTLEGNLNKPIAPFIDKNNAQHLEVLKKDQSISFTLDPNKTYFLLWHPIYNNGNEDLFWDDENMGISDDYQECYGPLTDLSKTNTLCGVRLNSTLKLAEVDNNIIEAKRNTNRLLRYRYYKITNADQLRYKPIRTDIVYSIVSVDEGNGVGLVDSLTTHIKSTGYFGDAKRVIEAKIDRQTNQLIGIFDYALYTRSTP